MTIAYESYAASSANATIYTYSSQSIGTADSNRIVYVMTFTRAAGGADITISSLTIGGVSATEQVFQQREFNGGDEHVSIWSAAVPTGTTADIVITYSREMARAGIGVYTSTDASAIASATATDVGATPSVTMTLDDGGTISACQKRSGSNWTGAGEDFDNSVESQIVASGSTGLSNTISNDASEGTTGTLMVAATFPRVGALSPILHINDDLVDDIGGRTITNNGVTVSSGRLQFNGSSEFSFPSDSDLEASTAFTLAWRMNPDTYSTGTAGGFARIVHKLSDFEVYTTNGSGQGTDRLSISVGSAYGEDSAVTLNTDAHYAFTVVGAHAALYVDGVQVGTGTVTERVANSNAVYIGNHSSAARAFDGEIWDFRMYNSLLSPAEVANVYSPPAASTKSSFFQMTAV